jgi:hypothetical protein
MRKAVSGRQPDRVLYHKPNGHCSESRLQNSANMPDPVITVTGTRFEKPEKSKTTYGFKVTVCNKTDHDIKIKLADNPWKTLGAGKAALKQFEPDKNGKGEPIPGSTRKKSLARWKNPDTGNSDPFTLTKNACKEFVLEYDFKPDCSYCDVFLMKPDGDPEEDYTPPTFSKMWEELKMALFDPRGPKPLCAVAFFIPYPMSLETVWHGPIEVSIDRIEGLPAGCELIHVFPQLRVPYRLDFADRHSQGAIFIRQLKRVTGRHTVRIYQRIVEPIHLRDWPERIIQFELVGSRRRPIEGDEDPMRRQP